jgi:hypothetical protein
VGSRLPAPIGRAGGLGRGTGSAGRGWCPEFHLRFFPRPILPAHRFADFDGRTTAGKRIEHDLTGSV